MRSATSIFWLAHSSSREANVAERPLSCQEEIWYNQGVK